MANHQDGGWIVIGIEELADGRFDLTGVPAANLPTWNHDDVSAMINGVADPHVAVDTDVVVHDDLTFVVIHIHEFVDIPVVARKDGVTPPNERSQVYKKNTCYARSRRKPETIDAISDPTTWRTLIELAATKLAARVYRVVGASTSTMFKPDDSEMFAAQLKDLK